jgi:hypothetical protein
MYFILKFTDSLCYKINENKGEFCNKLHAALTSALDGGVGFPSCFSLLIAYRLEARALIPGIAKDFFSLPLVETDRVSNQ